MINPSFPDAEATTEARITCPHCGAEISASMPLDARQIFYQCPHCVEMLRPKAGDCCVYCSYADTKCPNKQLEES